MKSPENPAGNTPMSGRPPAAPGAATLDLPLRGLASEGAEERIGPPLRALPGVRDVVVLPAEFRVRVTYDPAQLEPETIRERLHGIAHPDTAHGTQAPPRAERD